MMVKEEPAPGEERNLKAGGVGWMGEVDTPLKWDQKEKRWMGGPMERGFALLKWNQKEERWMGGPMEGGFALLKWNQQEERWMGEPMEGGFALLKWNQKEVGAGPRE